jgi:uncharacterized protein YkvS
MSDFASLRDRAFKILDRMVDELENKGEFTAGDAGIVEKVVKTCVILEVQSAKAGRDSGFKEAATEDLESEFE